MILWFMIYYYDLYITLMETYIIRNGWYVVDMLSAKGPTIVGLIEKTINKKHKKKNIQTYRGQLVQLYYIVQSEIVSVASKSHCGWSPWWFDIDINIIYRIVTVFRIEKKNDWQRTNEYNIVRRELRVFNIHRWCTYSHYRK